jgi:hypothetical protein
MGKNTAWFSLAAPVLSLLAFAGTQSPSEEEPRAVETLPVLELWYLLPKPETTGPLFALQRTMRDHAAQKFSDMGTHYYEREYADDEAVLVFFQYADLASERAGRATRSADREWFAMFQQTVDLVNEEDSHRSILFPIAGRVGSPAPKGCRVYSRSSVPPFRRIEAQQRAKGLVDHLNRTYPELNAYAYIDDLGSPYDLYLFVDHDTLHEHGSADSGSSWEATRRKFIADERYGQLQSQLAAVLQDPIVEMVVVTL